MRIVAMRLPGKAILLCLWMGLLTMAARTQCADLSPTNLPSGPPLPIGGSTLPAQLPCCPALPIPFSTGPAPPARATREPSANRVDPVYPPPDKATALADQATSNLDQGAEAPSETFTVVPPAGGGAWATNSPNMFGGDVGGNAGPGRITFTMTSAPPLTLTAPAPVPTPAPTILVNTPNPAVGGSVGRIQVAEDINPLPRDRLIFAYDFLNHVPLRDRNWDVNRVTFGFEKTFFNDLGSIDVRIPAAATLNNDIQVNGESTHTELGNVRLLLKLQLLGADSLHVAGGLGVHLPTAAATRVTLADGSDLVKIGNETIILAPFLGALWTPTPRLFAQTWVACNFDPRGNPVYLNPDSSGLNFTGRLRDQTLLQVDGQLGFWLIRKDESQALLRGLAPFFELHYNSALRMTDSLNSGNVVIGDFSTNHEELNFTTGMVLQLGDRLNLSLGAALPLTASHDRSFDWQVGLRANFLLGRAARSREDGLNSP
jgi:hypothetical protein